MQTGSRKQRQAAFTIFEVGIAAAVMALVLGSSLAVIGRGFFVLDSARANTYASQVMQSELEKMRLLPWGVTGSSPAAGAGLGNGTGTSYGVTNYPTTLTTVPIDSTFFAAGDFASRMTMQRIAADVHTGMIQVTLTISWRSLDRRTMTRSYTTYYGQNGLYDFFVL